MIENHGPLLAIDFDGTICRHDGVLTAYPSGIPVPGALAAVRALIECGFRLVVFTTRAWEPAAGLDGVKSWLADNGFPALPVTCTKPNAALFIDDRGLRFTGDWAAVLEFVAANPIPGRWEKVTK